MNIRRLGSVLGLAFSLAITATFDAAAHSGSMVEGVLYHLVGDQNPILGAKSKRIFYVESEDDGHKVPVDLSGAEMPPGGIPAALNRKVRVTAATAAKELQATSNNNGKMVARKLEILSPQRMAADDLFPVIGTRKYISLLCKWSGDASEPRAPSFFATQLGGTYPGFDHYFQEVSYGRANINGSSALGSWVTTAHAQTFFDTTDPNAGNYLFPMAQECVNAAEALGTSFAGVVGVNLMFNGLVDDCCAWGGSGSLVLDGVSRGVAITWMPYWGGVSPGSTFGWLHHGVLGHEMAHSFGSPHSNDPAGEPYGNYWDVVSRPGGTCAVTDATYGCVSQHPVGDNKLAMDFIAPARLATHPVDGAMATYNIERMASPPNAGGTFQLLKILTPNVLKYYTVEARLRTGYDQNLPGDGVLIHEVIDNRPFISFSNPGDPARLLTPTGTTAANTGDIDARWSAGAVYINLTDNVKITVVSFDAGTGTANIKVELATAPGEYSFTLAGSTVTEGGPAINVAVTRSPPFSAAGSVVWTTAAGGTAIAGTDYGAAGNPAQRTGTLTWTAGTGGTKNITVGLSSSNIPVLNEGTVEADETFDINLSSPVGGILGAQVSTTVTVNDGAVFAFASPTTNVAENGPNVTVTVQRSGTTTGTNAVTYTTVNGSALAGSDFGTNGSTILPTGTITFGPGETSKTITVGPTAAVAPYVRVNDDVGIEPPETFTLRLTTTTNGAIVPIATRDNVVTIDSNENGLAFVPGTASFGEGAGAQSVAVNRSGTAGAVSVTYTFGNVSALNGTHYNGSTGSLSWADGESGSKDIPFAIVDNFEVNTTRTFNVTLSAATGGASIVAPLSKAVTITDDDSSVQFPAPTVTTTEGLAGGNLVLTLARSGVLTSAATVTYTTVDGTGLVGTDFGALGNPAPVTGTVSWAAGVGGNRTFTIPIINDTAVEGVKNFRVQLSNPVGANLSIGGNDDVLVTLNDNDAGLTLEFANYNVEEGVNPSVAIRVMRTGPVTAATSATWTTVNGSATSGQDFGVATSALPRTGTVTWLAGDATPKTITIPILNDTLGGEGPQTFTVNLTPGAGSVLGAIGTTTVTIADNDIPPETNVQFGQAKYTFVEGVGAVASLEVQRVNLGPGFGLTSTVRYSTVPGTALATTDYTTATNVQITWPPGDSAPKTINIPLVNNATPEGHEYFKVVLSAPNGGTGLGAVTEATVLVLDDDEVFPPDGIIPAGFAAAGDTTAGWHVSNDAGAFDGVFTLKSDQIDDGQTAGLEMTGTFAAGTINFRVKVSTETGFDMLRFYVDGVLKQSWSGTAVPGWQTAAGVPLLAGPHTLRWVYEKDGTVSVGVDAVYIDALTTPAFTP